MERRVEIHHTQEKTEPLGTLSVTSAECPICGKNFVRKSTSWYEIVSVDQCDHYQAYYPFDWVSFGELRPHLLPQEITSQYPTPEGFKIVPFDVREGKETASLLGHDVVLVEEKTWSWGYPENSPYPPELEDPYLEGDTVYALVHDVGVGQQTGELWYRLPNDERVLSYLFRGLGRMLSMEQIPEGGSRETWITPDRRTFTGTYHFAPIAKLWVVGNWSFKEVMASE